MNVCPLVPWLKQHKLDQRQLARRLGAPDSSVSAYIAGKRGFRYSRFLLLAKLTGIPLAKLVGWSESAGAEKSHAGKAS